MTSVRMQQVHIREHGVTAEGDLVHGPSFMSLWMLIMTTMQSKTLTCTEMMRVRFQQTELLKRKKNYRGACVSEIQNDWKEHVLSI